MKHYSSECVEFDYPNNFRKKGDFPHIIIKKPKSSDNLSLLLITRGIDFIWQYNYSYNPERIKFTPDIKGELIRAGDYIIFPGAKEIIIKITYPRGNIAFYWDILVQIQDRIIEISISVDEDPSSLDTIWKPIVDSIKLNEEAITKFRDEDIQVHDWTKETQKPRHFKYGFASELVAIYDASLKMFEERDDGNDEEYLDIVDFSVDLFEKNFSKYDKRLLFRPTKDIISLPTTFYLNTKAPTEKGYSYIIEGLFGIDSGKVYVNSGEGPELEINMKPGVYKFRVYWGEYNAEDAEEYLRIYFWPTDEPETNEVKIIKPYEGGFDGAV